MADAIRRESPLSAWREEQIESAGLRVRELPIRAGFNLRGSPEDPAFEQAVRDSFGLPLPAANAFSARHGRLLAWLGPDEFLLLGADGDGEGNAAVLEGDWRARTAGLMAAITEVGAGFTTFEVAGAAGRDLLARGWSLDLHPRAFGPGRCAQSYLAKAPVLLLQRDPAPVFDIVIRRSFADYLRAWLAVSAAGVIGQAQGPSHG